MRAMWTALRGGLAGKRVQVLVIGLVLLASAAASTLAAGLIVASNAPFDHAFAAQHGADATVTVNGPQASAAELAATARLAGVTAAAGPFAEATVSASAAVPDTPGVVFQAFRLAGRSSPGGPVDDVVLSAGHWPTGPGQIVVSSDLDDTGAGLNLGTGQVITLTGVPGDPRLTVVGVANSVTDTADGWVLPAQMTALRVPLTEQMLYRFASAGSSTAVNAGVAAVRHALPAGAMLGAESWLTVQQQETGNAAPWVPFLVTFGLIGLVLSVLIVVNVVSGAVSAATRRIGVLKAVGFTPAQVVLVYVLQVLIPAVAGVVLGVVTANLLAPSLFGRTSEVFQVAPQSIPLWVDLAVPLAMLAVAAIAALVPASSAGRLSATAAIAIGRAPRPSRGYAVHRLLGRTRVLPRAVTLGLAGPFARPGRTLVTFAAIMFGALAVTFGVGLGTSLDRVGADLALASTGHVQIGAAGQQALQPPPGVPPVAAENAHLAAAIRAQPGTLHYVTESQDQLTVAGMAGTASVIAFGGDASWIGYAMISGHWYGTGRGAVVNTYFLESTGKRVGDTFTFTHDGRSVTLTITGEVFQPGSPAMVMTNQSAVAALEPPGVAQQLYYVGLRPGVTAQNYQNALFARLGPGDWSSMPSAGDGPIQILSGLVVILTLLLAVVAGFGVLNTVVLMTRERAYDIGVFKAVGMTPRQTIAMVVTTVAATGLIAGLIAVPAGAALHHLILPIMGDGAQTGFPVAIYNVYSLAELVLLALTGLVIAVAGALAPAGWAARVRTAIALRAELPPVQRGSVGPHARNARPGHRCRWPAGPHRWPRSIPCRSSERAPAAMRVSIQLRACPRGRHSLLASPDRPSMRADASKGLHLRLYSRYVSDWVTLADIGTAAGTLVLAGATFVAVRAAARSTRIAERALLAGQRPVLAPAGPDDGAKSVQFADGRVFPVGNGHALIRQDTGVIYLAIPLCNVGAGLAMLRGYRLQGEPADALAGDPRGVARHRRGDPSPQPQGFSPQQRDLLISASRAGFWQAALRDPEVQLYKELAMAVETGGRVTVDVLYGDHEGGQPSVTRFALLPEAGSWRCDATRYWSLPADRELRGFGFT